LEKDDENRSADRPWSTEEADMRGLAVLPVLLWVACDQPSDGSERVPATAIDLRVRAARVTDAKARALFESEVLKPLRDWRFQRDPERYFVAERARGSTRTSFLAVDSCTITDVTGTVARNPSLNVPFVGRVTFTSSYEIEGTAPDALIPPHPHCHTYQLVNGHWRLESQRYTIGALDVDCMIGHLKKTTWRVEAACLDESQRLIPQE
jgi:hypothetical protein